MDKYKIQYIFHEEKDVDDIFIKVLNKELKKYMLLLWKDKTYEEQSSCAHLSLEGGKH